MRAQPFLAIALLAIATLFVSLNLISANLLAGVRLDATQDRLYSVSDATKAVISKLDQKITFDFYASRGALAKDPALRLHGDTIADRLKTYVALSRGKIALIEHDTAPFSTAEEEAQKVGLIALSGEQQGDEPSYLGLVVRNNVDDTSIIAAFDPQREARLDYDLTRAILNTQMPSRTKIAVITSLPWLFSVDPNTMAINPIAKIAQELAATFDVTVVPPNFDTLPPDIKVLMLAQPGELSDFQLYLLDQFALRQGRLMILLDPASSIAKDGGGGVVSASQALGNLTQNWGFSVQSDVILDKAEALPVEAVISERRTVLPQPLYFSVPAQALSSSNLMTSGLSRGLHVATPGEIAFTQKSGLTFDPLLTTTTDTMRMAAARALASLTPQEVASEWEPAQSRFVLGAAISGTLISAFPDGPPPAPPRSAQAVTGIGPHLVSSTKPAEIVVIGDVDLLADSLYVAQDGDSADNAAFILNAMDILAGSDALVSLRARTASPRPLLVVERIKAQAQARVLEEEQQLQTSLETATARLDALEAKGSGAGFFSGQADGALSTSEQAEITRFRDEVINTRKRLRAVQEGVAKSVAQIKTLLIALTAFVVPLLVALTGIMVFVSRRSAARKARQRPMLEMRQN
jgi:ABC-2 type transport system permease protein